MHLDVVSSPTAFVGRIADAHEVSSPVLTTALITDIIGSTRTVAQLHDRRWSELLAEHYADAPAHVDRHHDAIAKTTGDGIVATFDSPTAAIRAAIALQATGRAADLGVRAGVHTGECQQLGDELSGVTMHVAARVCALGGLDKVITTRTVREIMIGSQLAFTPRGDHELKGVPGRWTIFGVTDPT